ncbi:hypothetical protein [Serratia silvae]|uniref:3-oxoacyl-ACP synthase n=1 Tax=Serratia silvae TaxID=2824122 RepID=A0ABT0KB95_9GAMM|nr:hypothetical protein [Serratia silvae]MCL1029177.1 hypothetical protein [Serratia silvae]
MEPLAVLASGMVTAVGFNSPTSCAAIRAGISGVEELNISEYIGSTDKLRGAKVNLPQWWNSLYKFVNLAAPAIWECLQAIPVEWHHHIPIFLGISLPHKKRLSDYDNLLNIVESKLNLSHHRYSKIIPSGQISGIHALKLTAETLLDEQVPCCIIAGTDSYLQDEIFDYYIGHRRIYTTDNSNGFFPGEAGAAVLVGLGKKFPKSTLHITGFGEGNEPSTVFTTDLPFRATGMTEALKSAVADSGIELNRINLSLSDLNGEYYKFNEMTIATSRFSRHDKPVSIDNIWHPIEYIGEVGAAIVPLLLGVALDSRQKGYNPGEHLLLHVGNDECERGALIANFR